MARPASVVAASDVDHDGRIDLFLAGPSAGEGEPALLHNEGELRFRPTAEAGVGLRPLVGLVPAGAVFVDVENDGHRDLLVVGRALDGGRAARLLRNRGDGRYAPLSGKLPAVGGAGAVPGAPGAGVEPEPPGGFAGVEVADYNEDGDLDLFLTGAGPAFRLWRNDGGNANHYIRVELTGLALGNGKVNRNGIGSRLEVRADDLLQVATVTDPVTFFGLGDRLKADVIRIEWTNGVPQYLYYPGTDADLREEQTLKGSCAFLYTWDGDGWRFVTDAMWKSAIGMPVGIMGGSGAGSAGEAGASPTRKTSAPDPWERRILAAPAASKEYLRVPGSALRARDGRYEIRLTEELWETAYVDEVKLLAVDHPDSVDVFVDERFVPPGEPELRIFRVGRRYAPVTARDGRGRDVRDRLLEEDDVHVSRLVPGRWQGTTEPHALVLDLGPPAAGRDSVFLFLQGWVFPTDASINVAMAQAGVRPRAPVLEVRDERGAWVPALPDLSFPSGKEKTVIADLTGAWRSESREVRIRTDMEVYWDRAFFTVGPRVAGPSLRATAEDLAGDPGRVADAAARGVRRLIAAEETGARGGPERRGGRGTAPPPAAPVPYGAAEGAAAADLRLTLLRPLQADLRARGFSREFRKGGRFGPHWFDYSDVSTEPRWLPIRGRATRYGEIGPLLLASDDLYAILAPGDEAAIEFSAAAAPPLPEGWSRDFLLYTDGWIKDADRNTATGETVEPLPWHGMSAYPPPPGEGDAFPGDVLHRLWDRALNTRELGGSPGGLSTELRAGPAPGGAESPSRSAATGRPPE